jgi:hypothetical protein
MFSTFLRESYTFRDNYTMVGAVPTAVLQLTRDEMTSAIGPAVRATCDPSVWHRFESRSVPSETSVHSISWKHETKQTRTSDISKWHRFESRSVPSETTVHFISSKQIQRSNNGTDGRNGNLALYDVTPCSAADDDRHFEGTYSSMFRV